MKKVGDANACEPPASCQHRRKKTIRHSREGGNPANKPIPLADIDHGEIWQNMSKLILRYTFDRDPGDDFGWLDVAVETPRFSGHAGFWVQWQDVEEFGNSLSTYPISESAPLAAAWGFEPWEGEALVISLQIAPANLAGDLKVRVEIADQHALSERLRTSFITDYSELEPFRIGIERLIKRQSKEAVLLGR